MAERALGHTGRLSARLRPAFVVERHTETAGRAEGGGGAVLSRGPASAGGLGRPAPVGGLLDVQRHAVDGGHVLVGEHLADQPGCRGPSGGQQQGVGDAGRDLLDMMGDEDGRRGVGAGAQLVERGHQPLAPAEVEAGARLVEQQQFRVGHHGAGDLDAFALTLAQGAVGAVGQMRHAEVVHEPAGAFEVHLVVVLVPAPVDGVAGRDDDVTHLLTVGDAVGHRGARQADARPQLEDVDRAEHLTEDSDDALGGVQGGGQDRQQRGLARPVRPDHDPALALVDAQVHVVQQQLLTTPNADPCKLCHRNHG